MGAFRPLRTWLGLFIVSVAVHMLLSWQASRVIVQPFAEIVPAAIEAKEVVIDLHQIQAKDELTFEDRIEFEPPPVLMPASALSAPPPDIKLAITAAAGGYSVADLAAPLLIDSIASSGEGLAGFGDETGVGFSASASRFALYVKGLRETGLDIVFVVDTTGSMDWVLQEVSNRIVDIVDTVRLLVPASRFGIVAYRDFGEPLYVTRLRTLTFSLNKLMRFLEGLSAEGGGTYQEAVYEAVKIAIEQGGWRLGAKKVVIVIGDAPPHKRSVEKLLSINRSFAQSGGQVSALDVGHDANPVLLEALLGRNVNRALYSEKPMLDFQLLAEAGGGVASTMDGDVEITRQLISLIMGGQFAHEMALLLEGL